MPNPPPARTASGSGASSGGGGVGQREVEVLAERAAHAPPQRVVAAHRLRAPAPAQRERDEAPVHINVVRLELGQPFEICRSAGEVLLGETELGEGAQALGGDAPQAVALDD